MLQLIFSMLVQCVVCLLRVESFILYQCSANNNCELDLLTCFLSLQGKSIVRRAFVRRPTKYNNFLN